MRHRTATDQEHCAPVTEDLTPPSRQDDASGVRQRFRRDPEAFDLARPRLSPPPPSPSPAAIPERPFDPDALPRGSAWEGRVAPCSDNLGEIPTERSSDHVSTGLREGDWWSEPASPEAEVRNAHRRGWPADSMATASRGHVWDHGSGPEDADPEDDTDQEPERDDAILWGEPERLPRPAAVRAGWIAVAISIAALACIASQPDARYELVRWGSLGHPRPTYAAVQTLLHWIASW